MADTKSHLDSAVGMVEEARNKVIGFMEDHPKWTSQAAHLLDGAIAKATRYIEYIDEDEIKEIESDPNNIFWAI